MSNAQTLEVPGYQVIRFLGSGARSTIWQVRDRHTDEVYALKCVVKRQSSDMRFLEQAINEYQVGSRFKHPVIRQIHGIRKIKRWLSLREIHVLMELCEGQTVQVNRPRSVREAVRVFGEVAGALAHMNAKGFVHADTKPNNILVCPGELVKLIDFGQSCPMGTVKTRIQGTPDFIAPEQVRRRPVDGRTDVFNFGAALYWTLTARPIPTVLPKEGSLTMKDGRRITPPEEINPEVPKPLGKLITDCVEIHPSQRPSSMNEVASRLSLISRQLARSEQGTS
ncbi:MAG TPA: serine/threonine-protein kinase [Phycisphaerae bacterium]|nr:serine/threonine-protein kinase [Phycisphaerae bacterium]